MVDGGMEPTHNDVIGELDVVALNQHLSLILRLSQYVIVFL